MSDLLSLHGFGGRRKEPVAEVLVDEDEDEGLPGLIPIPDDELATAPSTSAAATASPLCMWISDGYVMSSNWTRIVSPFSTAQMAHIH